MLLGDVSCSSFDECARNEEGAGLQVLVSAGGNGSRETHLPKWRADRTTARAGDRDNWHHRVIHVLKTRENGHVGKTFDIEGSHGIMTKNCEKVGKRRAFSEGHRANAIKILRLGGLL